MPRPNVTAACGCASAGAARSHVKKAAAVDPEIKAANLRRLRRLEGQIRGLQRMIEDERYCPDIMIQVSAAQEALNAVGRGLMRNHLRHCVAKAVTDGTAGEAEAMYDEIVDLIYRHAR
jgi:DNA-binding FrmR family transcriptional regulator